MEKVSVSQLKIGQRLDEEVLTHKGNILFNKSKTLTQRDIDILKAFQIKAVTIETGIDSKDTVRENKEEQQQLEGTKAVSTLQSEYDTMFNLLKKTFKSVNSIQQIPILEIRRSLEYLIENIKDYNPLTFAPPELKLEDTLYHNSIKVCLTAYSLAVWHGLPKKDLIPIALGGLFHDIGNMKVDPTILNRPAELTKDELALVQQHTVEGYNILKEVPGLNEGVKLTALQHHEKEDGSGYPLGIKSDQIHIYAKVVTIADIFHAMTSQRSYKASYSPYVVLEQLLDESFGKLDPALVQTFIHKATRFNHGTVVKLNDGSIGEIVFSEINYPTRPWVKVNDHIINLTTNRKLFIKEVIKGSSE